MPSFVIAEKCDGCKALDKTACQYICSNDLMVLELEKKKAFNQEWHRVLLKQPGAVPAGAGVAGWFERLFGDPAK